MKKLLFLITIIYTLMLILCSCGGDDSGKCAHEWSDPTCTKASICKLCGETSGSPLPHRYEKATCTAPDTCKTCGTTKGTALGHTLTKATCTAPAKCTVCNTSVGEKAEHSFTKATCAEPSRCTVCLTIKDGYGEHSFVEADCTTPKYCIICEIIESEPLGHDWVGSVCMTKNFCSRCDVEGEVIQHHWEYATCTTPKTCTNCKQSQGEAMGHDWVSTTCLEPKKCARCSETSNEDLPHTWVFTGCFTPGYCSTCLLKEEKAPGHDIVEATCNNPKYCNKCDFVEGSALKHVWSEATCTTPKTCTLCGLTEGTPKEHEWTYIGTVEPKCNEGKKMYNCICGETKNEFVLPDLVNYPFHICDESGLCSVCNNKYDVSKMNLDRISLDANTTVRNQGIFSTVETVTKIYKPITPTDVGIPVVNLNGDISSLTGKGPVVNIPFSYSDGELSFDCIAELKVQGASSAGYAKKNYSVKLYEADGTKNKVKLVDDWSKQFKYCLKANWVDYSQARNVVSGQLYGDVIDARGVMDELSNLPSGGAIDGFPVVVFNDGKFLGLYTMNIPKDKWMFDMKDTDEKNQAIVMAVDWQMSCAMRALISYNSAASSWTGSSGWELEYASNEDSTIDNSTVWVVESFNELINFVMNNDGEDFKNGIHQYADVNKCIDSLIYTFFICADDNISKNILWATYDGKHWFSSVYDMDGTWGMQWNGNLSFTDGNTHLINVLESNSYWKYNLLWEKLYKYFYDDIVRRYWEMRNGPLSIENITYRFESFFNQIPDVVRTAEKLKWSNAPDRTADHLKQILDYAKIRIEKMDAILKK